MSANQLVEVKTSPNLEVNLDLKPYLNLALAQNGIPWLNLEINNRSPLSLAKLQVKIQATPGFAHPYEETMGPFKAGERLFQENLELPLDFEYLANLRDVQPAALRVESTLPSHPSEVRNYSLTLYPPDQWLGLNFLPELLVSYVTPQLQLITQTLSLVAEELRRTTGSPSIEGYQKGKERAYAICQAAYRTLHSWGIRYTEPLHSWSDPGQRVRLIPDLYKNRQGTCLDTTLLLASLLERCGLNPVLMLTSGHAYLGCHLVERFFPDLLTDDLQLVRKLVDLDEFLVLETTQLTGANTFEEAEKLARQRHLFNSTELWAFDVQRARLSHIRPLPLVDSEEGEIAYKPQAPALPTPQLPAEELRSLKADLDLRQLAPPTRDRLQRWTQKLLDLSLRNRLLNTKSVSTVVPITCTEIGLLEDKLSAQQAFKFFPLEEIAPQAQPTNTKRASQAPPQLHKLLHGELEAGRLRVPLSAYDLKRRLTDLYRQSRNELEEGGANTLFLALGFLEWKASSRDAKSYWAPLLLLPVRLVRPSIAIGIHLERLEEETILNATLMELLRSQFGLVPPGLDPLPTDHSGVDVPLIFDIFRQAVKDRPGWEVHEEVRLGLFSFSKFIMWKDLSQRTEALKANPLVRQLLEGLPHLASELKPCFLMSPLSVAQYLPPNSQLFDLIIFDEASQITVWDAIGVVARGRQLIVVGDRWQMPPTNFFQKGEGGEDDDPGADFQDLESILDECLAAGVYSSYLNWHYRSRHESLIAFSNHHYYEDKLATFPSARQGPRLGVKLNLVEGCYERSGSRTNKVEARALVDYIFRELEDPQGKPRSIGVVTFSQAQRDLIDDLLEEERLRHPHLESYFSEHLQDPIFVKNLENVQGDERELILFSIGYAPDKEGRFSLNFGPLNRQGGERRLNVAITRAQEQVVVFSSIRSTQIDLSRTSAKGAAHLKYFLEYAEKGSSWVPTSGPRPTLPPWLEEIALFLEEHDYKVERLWGHSQYPIDLAVYHPQKPQEFLLAIEGDGPGYARQYTTRDRDHLRWEVLRSLGWNLYRAWSNDWLWDRERCQKDLLATLARLQKEPAPTSKADASTKVASTSKKASARSTSTTESPSPAQATPTPQALPQASPKEIEENNYYLSAQDWQLLELAKVASAPAPLKSAPTSKLAPASKATATSKSTSTSKSASVSKATPTPKASSTPVDTTKRESPAPAAPASTAAQSNASKQNSALPQAYRVWRPSTISSWPLYSTGSHKTKLLHQVREILECEAPICASLLKKRLISAWDIKESDSRWLRAWSRVAPSALTATSLGKENVYWLKPNDWLEYQSYRLPTTQRSWRRFLWEIPPEEVANAMLAILRGQGAISMERLYQETLQIFQAGDLDAQLRPYLDTALQYLQTSGRLNAN